MSFKIDHTIIKTLCETNYFPVPQQGLIFIGLRGAIPVRHDDQSFNSEQAIMLSAIDHTHPRCTLIQWKPEQKEMAVFPGSTVPHRKYISKALLKNGRGANMLMTGYYNDYRKGIHKRGSGSAHEAFLETKNHPIRRTSDDFDYENDDRVEFMNPYDNIHAAWSMGINHNYFASAGCQVICGYPDCPSSKTKKNMGPWKSFHDNAYNNSQDRFNYILLNGTDAYNAAGGQTSQSAIRLRYGSQGTLVEKLQKELKNKNFYEGIVDGDFGKRTLMAVLDFQTQTFSEDSDDGIVGPLTAEALGIDLS